MDHLLLTLRFYASGSYLISAGDFSGVSKTSAYTIVHRVTNAIARLRPRYIKFPTLAIQQLPTADLFTGALLTSSAQNLN